MFVTCLVSLWRVCGEGPGGGGGGAATGEAQVQSPVKEILLLTRRGALSWPYGEESSVGRLLQAFLNEGEVPSEVRSVDVGLGGLGAIRNRGREGMAEGAAVLIVYLATTEAGEDWTQSPEPLLELGHAAQVAGTPILWVQPLIHWGLAARPRGEMPHGVEQALHALRLGEAARALDLAEGSSRAQTDGAWGLWIRARALAAKGDVVRARLVDQKAASLAPWPRRLDRKAASAIREVAIRSGGHWVSASDSGLSAPMVGEHQQALWLDGHHLSPLGQADLASRLAVALGSLGWPPGQGARDLAGGPADVLMLRSLFSPSMAMHLGAVGAREAALAGRPEVARRALALGKAMAAQAETWPTALELGGLEVPAPVSSAQRAPNIPPTLETEDGE